MRAYNNRPAETAFIPAGTDVWKVFGTASTYPPNSFNSATIAPLIDAAGVDLTTEPKPSQGRFDPVHDPAVCPGGQDLGGYLYVGLSIGAVVAEGILRGMDIPATGILRRNRLVGSLWRG